MTRRKNILAFVMAGGRGSRLHPLTANQCKPAISFNGTHRIVDFALSNLVNSGICSIYVLVQYKSQSLIEHIRRSWTAARFDPRQFVTVVPPQMHERPEWFQGTADSVCQNIHLIERFQPDIVAVFGADHIYRMDVGQMVDFHIERDAQISVATLPVPLAQCAQFGIVQTDENHHITGFVEKPGTTVPMPGSHTHAMASMGNYLFSADVLLAVLRPAREAGLTDFGQDILPSLLETHRLLAYDFHGNTVPGTAPCEEAGYWRDVGTLDAYFDAHFDTLGARPKFRMDNRHWPIHANPVPLGPAQIESGFISRSSIGSGSIVNNARLDRALLRHSVQVDPGAQLEHCLVMERSRIGQGARIRRAIIDHDNDIPPAERIGFDLDADRRRFHVTDSGLVVVPACFFERARPTTAQASVPGWRAPADPPDSPSQCHAGQSQLGAMV